MYIYTCLHILQTYVYTCVYMFMCVCVCTRACIYKYIPALKVSSTHNQFYCFWGCTDEEFLVH